MAKAKKGVKKQHSKSYIVRTMREASDELKERAESYRDKFIAKPVKLSREFMEDLKNDPRNTLEDLIDDGKEFVEDIRTESRDRIDEFMADGKSFFKKVKKTPRKIMDEFIDDSREFVTELKNDTRDRFDGYVDDGKEVIEGIKKRINSRMKTVPSRLNLPSRVEIENLMNGIKAVDKKVDTISRQYRA